MANVLSPWGFRPFTTVTGLGHEVGEYEFSSAYASSIFAGDPVKSDGSGGLALAARGDAILGVFLGWYIPDRSLGYGNLGGGAISNLPHSRVWTPGTVIPTGISPRALVHHDPNEIFVAQCVGSITAADLGALVNLEPRTGSSVYGRSGYLCGPVAPEGGPMTSVTVGGSGSGYVQGAAITVTRHASDPYVGAADAAGTINVTTGNVTSVTLTSQGFYSATHLPTVTAPTGSSNTFLAVVTTTTRSQFRVERIIEKPLRVVDANNNTTGYGLTTSGLYATVQLKCMKHERGGSAMGVAV